MIEYLIEIVAGLIAAITVLTFHEFAHAFVAYKYVAKVHKWLLRKRIGKIAKEIKSISNAI